MTPLNVGLMGYGFSTKSFHLPFILPNPDLNIYAFLQRAEAPKHAKDVEPGKHCTVDYPHVKHYRTADEFFADPKIDLVVVCTQHDTHAEFAEKALLAGKHVVVEKPFTVSTQEADRVIKLAKSTNQILTVFQNRRYDSDFLTLQHLISNNLFGQIVEAELHYDIDFPFWLTGFPMTYTPGSGMMYGLGTHTLDQALLLFGRPKSITAFQRCLRDEGASDVDDTFTIILQYESKLVVTVKTSVVATMKLPLKYLVRGYEGSFVKFGDDVQEAQVGRGMKATDKGFGMEPEESAGLLTTKEKVDECQTLDQRSGRWTGRFSSLKGDYVGFYRDLVKVIRGQGELHVRPEESRDGIRIIELAKESVDKGITVAWS